MTITTMHPTHIMYMNTITKKIYFMRPKSFMAYADAICSITYADSIGRLDYDVDIASLYYNKAIKSGIIF